MCRISIPTICSTRQTTLAILAGFAHNRRVMVSGYHGTGKSTHIEQVAARLNWPCVRVNLDSHVSRIDLVGKDAIVLKDGMQVTEFRDGILPWAYQHNVALVLRRIRCRPPGRDVRHPARARILGPPDAARPEPRHPPAPGLPPVRHRQHGRPRRHHRPLSRHPADQPGADGPLVDRHDAELPAARQRGRHRRSPRSSTIATARAARSSQDGARRRPDARRLHQRRPVDRDEPAHGHHLGRERRDLRRCRLGLPRSPSSTSATSWSARWWPSSTSAPSATNCQESAANVVLERR